MVSNLFYLIRMRMLMKVLWINSWQRPDSTFYFHREREKNLLALNTDRQCHFNQHHQTQASAHELENIPKMNTQNMCVTWLTKYSRVFCSVVLCARARHCCYFFYCFWFSFLQKSKWLWVFIPTDWIPYRFIGSWLNTNFNAYQTEDR